MSWLESVTREKPAVQEVELWRVTKDTRELRCVVRYMPSGMDLRLLQGDDFRRTELLKDAPSVEARAAEWHKALLERWLDSARLGCGSAVVVRDLVLKVTNPRGDCRVVAEKEVAHSTFIASDGHPTLPGSYGL